MFLTEPYYCVMEENPPQKKAKIKVSSGDDEIPLQAADGPKSSKMFDTETNVEGVFVEEITENHEREVECDEAEYEEEITYSMKIPESTRRKLPGGRGKSPKIIVCTADETYETSKNIWTRDMTYVLIEEYCKMELDFQDPFKKQKDLWIKLAENMCHRGCDVTWDMCDQKWRNLKHTFKSIYYNTQRSKKSKRRWNFYEPLQNIFVPILINENTGIYQTDGNSPSSSQEDDSKPSISRTSDIPELLMPRISVKCKNEILEQEPDLHKHSAYIEKDDRNFNLQINNEAENVTTENISESPPPWFMDFMRQYREDENRRLALMKEMHSELLQVERRKCEVLEALLKKLT